MTNDELHIRIDSFSELEENWDTYGSEIITKKSIQSAHIILDTFLKDKEGVHVFPMRGMVVFNLKILLIIQLIMKYLIMMLLKFITMKNMI